jgi:hypothetical protein
MNRRHVQEGYDQVQQALLDYTVNCYPQIQVTYSSIRRAVLELFTSPKGFTLLYTNISSLNADLILTVLYISNDQNIWKCLTQTQELGLKTTETNGFIVEDRSFHGHCTVYLLKLCGASHHRQQVIFMMDCV